MQYMTLGFLRDYEQGAYLPWIPVSIQMGWGEGKMMMICFPPFVWLGCTLLSSLGKRLCPPLSLWLCTTEDSGLLISTGALKKSPVPKLSHFQRKEEDRLGQGEGCWRVRAVRVYFLEAPSSCNLHCELCFRWLALVIRALLFSPLPPCS